MLRQKRKKYIISVVSFLFLLLATGSGFFLVKRSQDNRQYAKQVDGDPYNQASNYVPLEEGALVVPDGEVSSETEESSICPLGSTDQGTAYVCTRTCSGTCTGPEGRCCQVVEEKQSSAADLADFREADAALSEQSQSSTETKDAQQDTTAAELEDKRQSEAAKNETTTVTQSPTQSAANTNQSSSIVNTGSTSSSQKLSTDSSSEIVTKATSNLCDGLRDPIKLQSCQSFLKNERNAKLCSSDDPIKQVICKQKIQNSEENLRVNIGLPRYQSDYETEAELRAELEIPMYAKESPQAVSIDEIAEGSSCEAGSENCACNIWGTQCRYVDPLGGVISTAGSELSNKGVVATSYFGDRAGNSAACISTGGFWMNSFCFMPGDRTSNGSILVASDYSDTAGYAHFENVQSVNPAAQTIYKLAENPDDLSQIQKAWLAKNGDSPATRAEYEVVKDDLMAMLDSLGVSDEIKESAYLMAQYPKDLQEAIDDFTKGKGSDSIRDLAVDLLGYSKTYAESDSFNERAALAGLYGRLGYEATESAQLASVVESSKASNESTRSFIDAAINSYAVTGSDQDLKEAAKVILGYDEQFLRSEASSVENLVSALYGVVGGDDFEVADRLARIETDKDSLSSIQSEINNFQNLAAQYAANNLSYDQFKAARDSLIANDPNLSVESAQRMTQEDLIQYGLNTANQKLADLGFEDYAASKVDVNNLLKSYSAARDKQIVLETKIDDVLLNYDGGDVSGLQNLYKEEFVGNSSLAKKLADEVIPDDPEELLMAILGEEQGQAFYQRIETQKVEEEKLDQFFDALSVVYEDSSQIKDFCQENLSASYCQQASFDSPEDLKEIVDQVFAGKSDSEKVNIAIAASQEVQASAEEYLASNENPDLIDYDNQVSSFLAAASGYSLNDNLTPEQEKLAADYAAAVKYSNSFDDYDIYNSFRDDWDSLSLESQASLFGSGVVEGSVLSWDEADTDNLSLSQKSTLLGQQILHDFFGINRSADLVSDEYKQSVISYNDTAYTGPATTKIGDASLQLADNSALLGFEYQTAQTSYYHGVRNYQLELEQLNQTAIKNGYAETSLEDYVARQNNEQILRDQNALNWEVTQKAVAPTILAAGAIVAMPLAAVGSIPVAVGTGTMSGAWQLYQASANKAQSLDYQKTLITDNPDLYGKNAYAIAESEANPELSYEEALAKADKFAADKNNQANLQLLAAGTSALGVGTQGLGAAGLTGASKAMSIATKVGSATSGGFTFYNSLETIEEAKAVGDKAAIITSGASAVMSLLNMASLGLTTSNELFSISQDLYTKVDIIADATGLVGGSALDVYNIAQECSNSSYPGTEEGCRDAWIGLALSLVNDSAQLGQSVNARNEFTSQSKIAGYDTEILKVLAVPEAERSLDQLDLLNNNLNLRNSALADLNDVSYIKNLTESINRNLLASDIEYQALKSLDTKTVDDLIRINEIEFGNLKRNAELLESVDADAARKLTDFAQQSNDVQKVFQDELLKLTELEDDFSQGKIVDQDLESFKTEYDQTLASLKTIAAIDLIKDSSLATDNLKVIEDLETASSKINDNLADYQQKTLFTENTQKAIEIVNKNQDLDLDYSERVKNSIDQDAETIKQLEVAKQLAFKNGNVKKGQLAEFQKLTDNNLSLTDRVKEIFSPGGLQRLSDQRTLKNAVQDLENQKISTETYNQKVADVEASTAKRLINLSESKSVAEGVKNLAVASGQKVSEILTNSFGNSATKEFVKVNEKLAAENLDLETSIVVDQSGKNTEFRFNQEAQDKGFKQADLDKINQTIAAFEDYKGFKIYSNTDTFKDQDKFILAELASTATNNRGSIFGALPGMGKTDVVMPLNAILKQKLTGDPQFIVFPEGKLAKPWTTGSDYQSNEEFIKFVESQLGKDSVLIVKPNEIVDPALIRKAKVIVTTKDVAFDLMDTDSAVGVALRSKWQESYVHADEVHSTFNPRESYKTSNSQDAITERSDYADFVAAQKKILGIDENGNKIADGGLKALDNLISKTRDEAVVQDQISRNAEGQKGAFTEETELTVLRQWIDGWDQKQQLDLGVSYKDVDLETLRNKVNDYLGSGGADLESLKIELTVINKTADLLAAVPGIDYGLVDNDGVKSIAPREESRDTGRSYSSLSEQLIYNSVGANILKVADQIDINQIKLGDGGNDINYAQLMLESKGFSLYTGTPETVSNLFKQAYGIETKTFTDSALEAIKERIVNSDSELYQSLEDQATSRLDEDKNLVVVNMDDGKQSNEVVFKEYLDLYKDNSKYSTVFKVGANGELQEGIIFRNLDQAEFVLVKEFTDTDELNIRTAELDNNGQRYIKFYEYGAHTGVDTKNNVDLSRVVAVCRNCDETTFSQGVNRVRTDVDPDRAAAGGEMERYAPIDVVWLDDGQTIRTNDLEDFTEALHIKQVTNQVVAETYFKETLLKNSLSSSFDELISLTKNGKKGFLGIGTYKANADLAAEIENIRQSWKEVSEYNARLGENKITAEQKLQQTAEQVAGVYRQLEEALSGSGAPADLLALRANGALEGQNSKIAFVEELQNLAPLSEKPSYNEIVDLINQSSKHLADSGVDFSGGGASQTEVQKYIEANKTQIVAQGQSVSQNNPVKTNKTKVSQAQAKVSFAKVITDVRGVATSVSNIAGSTKLLTQVGRQEITNLLEAIPTSIQNFVETSDAKAFVAYRDLRDRIVVGQGQLANIPFIANRRAKKEAAQQADLIAAQKAVVDDLKINDSQELNEVNQLKTLAEIEEYKDQRLADYDSLQEQYASLGIGIKVAQNEDEYGQAVNDLERILNELIEYSVKTGLYFIEIDENGPLLNKDGLFIRVNEDQFKDVADYVAQAELKIQENEAEQAAQEEAERQAAEEAAKAEEQRLAEEEQEKEAEAEQLDKNSEEGFWLNAVSDLSTKIDKIDDFTQESLNLIISDGEKDLSERQQDVLEILSDNDIGKEEILVVLEENYQSLENPEFDNNFRAVLGMQTESVEEAERQAAEEAAKEEEQRLAEAEQEKLEQERLALEEAKKNRLEQEAKVKEFIKRSFSVVEQLKAIPLSSLSAAHLQEAINLISKISEEARLVLSSEEANTLIDTINNYAEKYANALEIWDELQKDAKRLGQKNKDIDSMSIQELKNFVEEKEELNRQQLISEVATLAEGLDLVDEVADLRSILEDLKVKNETLDDDAINSKIIFYEKLTSLSEKYKVDASSFRKFGDVDKLSVLENELDFYLSKLKDWNIDKLEGESNLAKLLVQWTDENNISMSNLLVEFLFKDHLTAFLQTGLSYFEMDENASLLNETGEVLRYEDISRDNLPVRKSIDNGGFESFAAFEKAVEDKSLEIKKDSATEELNVQLTQALDDLNLYENSELISGLLSDRKVLVDALLANQTINNSKERNGEIFDEDEFDQLVSDYVENWFSEHPVLSKIDTLFPNFSSEMIDQDSDSLEKRLKEISAYDSNILAPLFTLDEEIPIALDPIELEIIAFDLMAFDPMELDSLEVTHHVEVDLKNIIGSASLSDESEPRIDNWWDILSNKTNIHKYLSMILENGGSEFQERIDVFDIGNGKYVVDDYDYTRIAVMKALGVDKVEVNLVQVQWLGAYVISDVNLPILKERLEKGLWEGEIYESDTSTRIRVDSYVHPWVFLNGWDTLKNDFNLDIQEKEITKQTEITNNFNPLVEHSLYKTPERFEEFSIAEISSNQQQSEDKVNLQRVFDNYLEDKSELRKAQQDLNFYMAEFRGNEQAFQNMSSYGTFIPFGKVDLPGVSSTINKIKTIFSENQFSNSSEIETLLNNINSIVAFEISDIYSRNNASRIEVREEDYHSFQRLRKNLEELNEALDLKVNQVESSKTAISSLDKNEYYWFEDLLKQEEIEIKNSYSEAEIKNIADVTPSLARQAIELNNDFQLLKTQTKQLSEEAEDMGLNTASYEDLTFPQLEQSIYDRKVEYKQLEKNLFDLGLEDRKINSESSLNDGLEDIIKKINEIQAKEEESGERFFADEVSKVTDSKDELLAYSFEIVYNGTADQFLNQEEDISEDQDQQQENGNQENTNFQNSCSSCSEVRVQTQEGLQESDRLWAAAQRLYLDGNKKEADALKKQALQQIKKTRKDVINEHGMQNQCVQMYLQAWADTREAEIRQTRISVNRAITAVREATSIAENILETGKIDLLLRKGFLGIGEKTNTVEMSESDLREVREILDGNNENKILGLREMSDILEEINVYGSRSMVVRGLNIFDKIVNPDFFNGVLSIDLTVDKSFEIIIDDFFKDIEKELGTLGFSDNYLNSLDIEKKLYLIEFPSNEMSEIFSLIDGSNLSISYKELLFDILIDYEEVNLSPMDKEELLKSELLSNFSLDQYVRFWKNLSPFYLSHVTRQGFRDHNAMIYHSNGMNEFSSGFMDVVNDDFLLKSPLAIELDNFDYDSIYDWLINNNIFENNETKVLSEEEFNNLHFWDRDDYFNQLEKKVTEQKKKLTI
jgi:hypothetical protein